MKAFTALDKEDDADSGKLQSRPIEITDAEPTATRQDFQSVVCPQNAKPGQRIKVSSRIHPPIARSLARACC